MASRVEITAAEKRTYTSTTRKWAWFVTHEVTQDDGKVDRYQHVIDPVVIAARAAEYDLDPEDIDTILDILLCEPYMTPDEYGPHLQDFVYHTDAATARTAHLRRVKAVKQRLSLATKHDGKAHPLDAIRAAHNANHEFHQAFKEYAAGVRAGRRVKAALVNQPDDYDAVADFAKQINRRLASSQAHAREGQG